LYGNPTLAFHSSFVVLAQNASFNNSDEPCVNYAINQHHLSFQDY